LIYILWGQDDFSLSQALEEIKTGIGEPTVLLTNTTFLDGQQASLDQLKTVCETLPFLAERRLVVVRGLLERFEPRGKSGRQKKTARPANQPGEFKPLADFMVTIPDSTTLVLVDNEITAGNPLLKELAGKAEARSFPLMKEARLRQWVQQRVTEEGGSISPAAIDLLVKLVGGNLWIMASEVNKLVTFASGRRIEEVDVRAVVSYAQQASVFAMVDAILESRAGEAERWLEQLRQSGASAAYLMAMLSRQVRMIVRVWELRRQGKSRTDIQNKLGLPSEFALRKTLEQADRYPLPRIRAVYGRLLEADLSIKTGKYDGWLALNILIAELCQRRRNR
jgi:DNA polymerase-3 subunit delta